MGDAAQSLDTKAGGERRQRGFSWLWSGLRRETAKVLLRVALYPADVAAALGPTSSASMVAFSHLAASLARLYAVSQDRILVERAGNQWQRKAREEVRLHGDIIRRLVTVVPHRLS